MALLFCDGFAHYGQEDLPKKWDSANSWLSTAINLVATNVRRAGVPVLWFDNNTNNNLRKAIGTITTAVTVGFALRENTLGSCVCTLHDAVGPQCSVTIESDGSVTVRRGYYNGTILGQSAGGVLSALTWHYIEFKIYVHDTTGTFEVHVDGVQVLVSTGAQDTKNQTSANVTMFGFEGYKLTDDIRVCDLYICDASGSYNNTFLGDIRIDAILPSGAGAYAQWDPSGEAENYQCVDESDINEDTDYSSTDVTNEIDSHLFTDLASLTIDSIKAAVLNLCFRKDDAGSRTVKGHVRVSSNNYEGASTFSVPDTYTVQQQVWETNPYSSAAWTRATLNAAEFGAKLIS